MVLHIFNPLHIYHLKKFHKMQSLKVIQLSPCQFYIKKRVKHKPSYHLKAGPNQDCPNATMMCSDSSFDGNASGYGTQELYGSSPSNRGCLIGEVDQNFKGIVDRKSTRLNSSHVRISYA